MRRHLPYWCYYAHQGMVSALTLQGVVGYFRHSGLDLAQLSWLPLTMTPWVAKFLWAPWCERHAIGLRGHPYLGSLVLLQLAMAAVLGALGLLSPGGAIGAVAVALTLLSFLSASHGVYANGIVITTTDERDRPFANAAQVGGSYLGLALGSFAFLAIADRAGWGYGFAAVALCSALLLLPPLAIRQAATPAEPAPPQQARLGPDALGRLWPVLTLTAIFYLAMRGVMAVQTVILADQGYSLTRLGEIIMIYSTAASGAGVVLGGWLARRLGAWRSLPVVMALHAVLITLGAAAYPALDPAGLAGLFGLLNVAAATGFVVLYNGLMGLVRPHQPASDYALFQSVDMAVAMLTSMAALRLAHLAGYAQTLAVLAAIAVAVLWPAQRLLRRIAAASPRRSRTLLLEEAHG